RPPRPPLFPYTTLFRSRVRQGRRPCTRGSGPLPPIFLPVPRTEAWGGGPPRRGYGGAASGIDPPEDCDRGQKSLNVIPWSGLRRSEEHTSELQSRGHLV